MKAKKIVDFHPFSKQNYSFINRNVNIREEEGNGTTTFPCIVLIDNNNDIPVAYTGYEKFINDLSQTASLSGTTLSKKAFDICKFLNFILHNTNIDRISDCTLNDIREFLLASKKKNGKEDYAEDTWNRRLQTVYTFLRNYYLAYRDIYDFKYDGEDLQNIIFTRDKDNHRMIKFVTNQKLSVKAPKQKHKKNRMLVYGYLELLLYEALKYDPMIALGIALQSFSGAREGEVVNLTVGGVAIVRATFSAVSGIELDLLEKASFWEKFDRKTQPGSIKKYRKARIYDAFVKRTVKLYEDHVLFLQARGYSTEPDAPLFLNKYGNPMTVQTYSRRVKELFYEHFLPHLKETCERQNTWAENAAYIETYEKEYPGAHMFRHWFTMYLITKAHLKEEEIANLRGDKSIESMASYIHENSDLIEIYKTSAYRFQEKILEEINKLDGK